MGDGVDESFLVKLRPPGSPEDLMRGTGVDDLLLAWLSFSNDGSTTDRAGRLIPAAKVSVQTQIVSSFF